MTNNKISYELFYWLRNIKDQDVIMLQEDINIHKLKEIEPDLIISYNYKYIIKKDIIDYMKKRIINLHISLLPWNRGASPNLWSFLEDTRKGVTIHLIDEGLDTGKILLQKEIIFDESKETLKSSYDKLHKEIVKLFKENWKDIKNDRIVPKPQKGVGTKHFVNDFKNIKSLITSWDINILKLKNLYKNFKGDLNDKRI
nr:formyltransferase family protein [Clostridium tyrobutyricum]